MAAKAPAVEPEPGDTSPPVDTAEQVPAESTPDTPAAATTPGGRYRFTGAYPQIYMDRSLLADPGETYEWPDGPPADGRWIEEK